MVDISKYSFLKTINNPNDLRQFSESDLPQICNEVRCFLIETITKYGGHFGSGLGVVELTVALHYIFNTPDDKIVFDVGHQAYPHKILTGRKEQLHTIRQYRGISGFPNIFESEYDAFGVGHASTSISAALGMATSRDSKKENHKVLAIIGDGSMTGGMAFEAMNNCGFLKKDILIILNDNNMSIDSNVSGFSDYFTSLFSSQTTQSIREGLWNTMGKMPSGDRLRKFATRLEDSLKAIITPGVLFESLGFNYFGPINGHNLPKLLSTLKKVKDLKGPILLHIMTEKGKGYLPAEQDKQKLHAISKKIVICEDDCEVITQSYSSFFGEALLEIMQNNKSVIAITAAMTDGTGLKIVQKEIPDRVFDVGIAEGHAVTYAAGLASSGFTPVVAIYSSFLQRAYDSIIHDVALQKLHVVFALDRAGIVGEDGPTHHGTFDIAYLQTIPNMVLTAPKDEQEFRSLLHSAINHYTDGPVAIRFPRGKGLGVEVYEMEDIKIGTWEKLLFGFDVAILAVGSMVNKALSIANILRDTENLNIEVINARFIKPFDENMLIDILNRHKFIFTMEEGQLIGGFGNTIKSFSVDNGFNTNIFSFGIPDIFVTHGSTELLLKELELDNDSLVKKIISIMKK